MFSHQASKSRRMMKISVRTKNLQNEELLKLPMDKRLSNSSMKFLPRIINTPRFSIDSSSDSTRFSSFLSKTGSRLDGAFVASSDSKIVLIYFFFHNVVFFFYSNSLIMLFLSLSFSRIHSVDQPDTDVSLLVIY